MTLHRNARTCPRSRRLLAERVLVERWSLAAAAEAAGVSKRTAWKWVDRFRAEGVRGLEDRSSAPQRVPGRTPNNREQAIVCLRELRFTSPEIAESLGMPLSTVGAVLSRYGLGKLPRLRPEEPANSYQRPRPGELVHIDVEKLGKMAGPAIASTATVAPGRAGSAGSSCTWPSTTRPGSPTSRCSPTRKQRPQSAACAGRSPSFAATGFESSGGALTTAPSTARAASDPPHSPAGSTGTTDSDRTAPSADSHHSPASAN